MSVATGQIVGAVALIGALAAAPAGAEAVLLVPFRSGADLASAYDLTAATRAGVLTTGPIAGSLVATNTPDLRNSGLGAGFLVIGWEVPACGERS